jgi:hypothetical protein
VPGQAMAQLTVDVSMADALVQSGREQGSPSPRSGVAQAGRTWTTCDWHAADASAPGTAGVAASASQVVAVPAAVAVLQGARSNATATNWYQPEPPLAVVGMQLVQAGRSVAFDASMPMATVVETLAAVPPLEDPSVGGGLVQTSRSGPIRSVRKDRQLMRLAEKWRCPYCKTFGDRESDAACTGCGAARTKKGTEAATSARERARFDARKKSSKGRQLNTVGSGQAAGVERKAAGASGFVQLIYDTG